MGLNGGISVLTLNTTAPSTNAASTQPNWLIPMTASLACVLLVLPTKWRRSRQLLPLICLGMILFGLQACGGGGGGGVGSTGGSGTPPPPPAATTTALTSSSAKVASGADVTLTASVLPTGSNATGSVMFYDGTTTLGSATLNGGKASLTLGTLSIGTHSLTAKYSGDSGNAASTSGVFNQTITGTVQLTVVAASGSEQQTLTIPVIIQ